MIRILSIFAFFGTISEMLSQSIDHDIFNGVRNLVHPDRDMNGYLEGIGTSANFVRNDLDRNAAIDIITHQRYHELVPSQFHFLLSWANPHLAQLQAMRFGSNVRVISVAFENHRVSGAEIFAKLNAILAYPVDNKISIRLGYGHARSRARRLTRVHHQEVCWEDCGRKCRIDVMHLPRDPTPGEWDWIDRKLEREAAQTFLQQISHQTGIRGADARFALSDSHLEEIDRVRTLYSVANFITSDLNEVNQNDLSDSITASSNKITDDKMKSRIVDIATKTKRSSFLVIPDHETMLVMRVQKNGEKYSVKMSTFTIEGRLPAGAFAHSTGAWNLERVGEGAAPSIHQILGMMNPIE